MQGRGHRGTGRRSGRPSAAALVALLLAAAGCGGPHKPPTAHPGVTERGLASWYGPGFHGRRTANGEVYDMERLTAAHRTLPFGTWVRVENLDNGRSVEVRINDRGPFIRGRIIDLSRAAARQLDMLIAGVARVKLTVLAGKGRKAAPAAGEPRASAPEPAAAAPTPGLPAPDVPAPTLEADTYTVQVGAFRDLDRARRLARRLEPFYPEVRVESGSAWHRVQIGRFTVREEALRLQDELIRMGYEAVVHRAPAPPATP